MVRHLASAADFSPTPVDNIQTFQPGYSASIAIDSGFGGWISIAIGKKARSF